MDMSSPDDIEAGQLSAEVHAIKHAIRSRIDEVRFSHRSFTATKRSVPMTNL
jgi:hypothetical protein